MGFVQVENSFYIFFLNPDYVAARSLRSLRSKKGVRILEFITFYQNALHLTRLHCATFYQNALRHELNLRSGLPIFFRGGKIKGRLIAYIREFKKPRRRRRGQRRLKMNLHFTYESCDILKSFSLFLTVQTISKLNMERSVKFGI